MASQRSQDVRNHGGRAEGGSDNLVFIDVRQWSETENARSETTHVSAPAEVACFSRADDRSVEFGSRGQLQRFQDPRLNSRLDQGFHQFVPKTEEEGVGVEPVLACLQSAGFDLESEADIVTYRNNLNKVCGWCNFGKW